MNSASLRARLKCLTILVLLMVADIGPIPVTALLALFIVLVRPKWFRDMTRLIYEN